MTPQYVTRYELLVFDGARNLAVKHGQDTISMRKELISMG
jgi:hypothetical protein